MWVYIHVCIYKDRWRNETQYASLKTTDWSACRGIKLSKSLIPAVDSKHCGENWPQPWSPGSADGACKKGLETALCEEGVGCHSPAGMTAQPRHTEEAVRWGRNFSAAKISCFQDPVLHYSRLPAEEPLFLLLEQSLKGTAESLAETAWMLHAGKQPRVSEQRGLTPERVNKAER